jgi:hypothetical protein
MLEVNCLYKAKSITNIYKEDLRSISLYNEDLRFISYADNDALFLVIENFYSVNLLKSSIAFKVLVNDKQAILVFPNNSQLIERFLLKL